MYIFVHLFPVKRRLLVQKSAFERQKAVNYVTAIGG